jgi:uncharacterized protein YuzE
MGKMSLIEKEIHYILPHIRKAKLKQLYVDYDEGADVMYISFEKPQNATDTVTREDGTLLRYRGKHLVGITILNYSTGR